MLLGSVVKPKYYKCFPCSEITKEQMSKDVNISMPRSQIEQILDSLHYFSTCATYWELKLHNNGTKYIRNTATAKRIK
jgi:hypothetical protein